MAEPESKNRRKIKCFWMAEPESKIIKTFKSFWMAEPGRPILPKRQNGRIIINLIEPAARGGSAS